MEEILDLVENYFKERKNDENLIKNLVQLIEDGFQELETLKNMNNLLETQLNAVLSEHISHFNTRLNTIEDQKSRLKSEIVHLREEIDKLNIAILAKNHEFRSKYTEIKQKMIDNYENQVKQKNSVINLLVTEHEAKMHQIQLKLTSIKHNSDIQKNGIEVSLTNEINCYKKEHTDNVVKLNALRQELKTIKEQFSEYKINANQEILELESQLFAKQIDKKQEAFRANFELMHQSTNSLDSHNLEQGNREKVLSASTSKYPALDVKTNNNPAIAPDEDTPPPEKAPKEADEPFMIDFDYDMNEYDNY